MCQGGNGELVCLAELVTEAMRLRAEQSTDSSEQA